MNYSIPVYDGVQLPDEILKSVKQKLDTILDQQIMICDLARGITFEDTENMDEYTRIYTFHKLLQIRKEEVEAKKQAIDKIKNK